MTGDPRFIHEEYLKNLDAAAELPGHCAGVLVHLGQFLGTCHGVLRSKRENCRASDPGVGEAAGGAVPAAVCDTQGRPHDGVCPAGCGVAESPVALQRGLVSKDIACGCPVYDHRFFG